MKFRPFALKHLVIVIKNSRNEYLIDCLYVPINRDTSDCSEVTRVDNTFKPIV